MKQILNYLKNSIRLILIMLPATSYSQGMQINNCNIRVQGPLQLILHNASITNNGNISISNNATVWFTGNKNAVIGGSNPSALPNIVINKSGDAEIELYKDISVSGTITMQNNNLLLNNHTLNLGNTGSIIGENSESYITTHSNGRVLVTRSVTKASHEYNPGNIGVALTSNIALGNLTIERKHLPHTLPGGLTGIRRSFTINSSAQNGLNAGLRFFYLNEELNGSDENGLLLWTGSAISNSWIPAGVDGSDASNNWIYKEGLDRLGRFTLAADGSSFKSAMIKQEGFTKPYVYPNPSTGICRLIYYSSKEKETVFNLYDQNGRPLLQKKMNSIAGMNTLTLDLNPYTAGTYLVTDNTGAVQVKIIRQ